MRKIIILCISCFSVISCAIIPEKKPPPQYDYAYVGLPADPEIVYKSDFDGLSLFSVGTRTPEKPCAAPDAPRERIGHTLRLESIFDLRGYPLNEEVKIKVPAGRTVSVYGFYSQEGHATCNPPYMLGFIPQTGQKYTVRLVSKGDMCSLSVTYARADGSSEAVPVDLIDMKSCYKK